jgi:choline dehydrogenase-like flavoprotein
VLQMGSMRMATSPLEGPVNEDGQVWEAEGLYCMDASVFPTSLGEYPPLPTRGRVHRAGG